MGVIVKNKVAGFYGPWCTTKITNISVKYENRFLWKNCLQNVINSLE